MCNNKYCKVETVHNISELIDVVSKSIGCSGRIFWFRGHYDSSWKLTAGIWRNYLAEDERNFVHRFRARAYSRKIDVPGYYERAKWLSIMQHYELPTRLLDWSRSPLIALFFALEKYIYEKDVITNEACIWMLQPHELNRLEKFGDFTPSIESEKCKELIDPAFDEGAEINEKIYAVMSSEIDTRMFVQQGCFTLHSRSTLMDETPECNKYLTKILIPKECAKDMAQQLDYCGFRKGDLFPDLINLSKEFKGIFKPRF